MADVIVFDVEAGEHTVRPQTPEEIEDAEATAAEPAERQPSADDRIAALADLTGVSQEDLDVAAQEKANERNRRPT